MATTAAIPSSVHASSSSSSSQSNEFTRPARASILRTRSRHAANVGAAPPSPLLKRALERTVSIHTSMGSMAKAAGPKRSIALAPVGPSSSARRLSINPPSPVLKSSALMTSGGSQSITLSGSATLVVATPGSPSLSRTKSKGRMEKIVGFDLSSRELLKARKLAQKGFEEKTGKNWQLTRNKSQLEMDLYEQEVRKHEARMFIKKQDECDQEQTIQSSIDSRYSQIAAYQVQLAEKEAELAINKDIAEQSKKDIETAIKDMIMKGSAVTDEKSSEVRMRVQQQKKEVKKQMINAVDVNDPRRKVLQLQQETEEIRTIISLLKKEIAKIKHDASFEKSSKARMKAAKKAQEAEKASGVVKVYAPPKVKVPKPVVPKSANARMEAAKAAKAAKRGELRGSGGLNRSGGRNKPTLRASGMIRQSSGLRSSSVHRSTGSSSAGPSSAH